MLCHLPLLVPLGGLVLFVLFPLPVALALYLPLTAISLAISIPAVRALYRPVTTGEPGMRGQEGVVVTADGRFGMLRCQGELWTYRAAEPVRPGQRVAIVELDGLVAVVRPGGRDPGARREGVAR
jgi:membrane protein implicated in regulation of membrane protease activity